MKTCTLCASRHYGRGYCRTHWKRWYKHGDPNVTLRSGQGTHRTVTEDGYVLVYRPDHPLARTGGYVLEHRAVAWDHGILTDPTDLVHHHDGDKQNNSPTNLEAIPRPEHQSLHRAAVLALNPTCRRCGADNWYMRPDGHRTCRPCARRRERARC